MNKNTLIAQTNNEKRISILLGLFVLIICLCTLAPLRAATPNWDISRDLNLKKDEVYKTSFFFGGGEKKLYFYWTLYKNYGLVINLNYDGFAYQFILYADYKRKSFKIPLNKGADINKDTYLLLSFVEFDNTQKLAHLWLGVMLPTPTITN